MNKNEFEILKKITYNTYLIKVNNKKTIATKSKYSSHYGERIFSGYREWLPNRSKLAAMFLNGYCIDINPKWRVLYLGAATGTTVSHLADILEYGYIYAVEISPKPFMRFLSLAKERSNIIPILDDASKPWRYSGIVEKVDFIYQDIAQRNQLDIFLENIKLFLKESGQGLIMVKARSINSTIEPQEVFKNVICTLKRKIKIIKHGSLEPFHKDHIFVHVST